MMVGTILQNWQSVTEMVIGGWYSSLIELAQDCIQWRALVLALLNDRVLVLPDVCQLVPIICYGAYSYAVSVGLILFE
jgi:hypothetical protein